MESTSRNERSLLRTKRRALPGAQPRACPELVERAAVPTGITPAPTRPRDSLPAADREDYRPGRDSGRQRRWFAEPWETALVVLGMRLRRRPRRRSLLKAARIKEWPMLGACACRGSVRAGDDLPLS